MLLDWYAQAGRDLPWRRTRDPYAIWVSEIMCQQTQVATVIPYWEKWMVQFPTVQILAQAHEQSVLAAWAGLGYYRRARMLHAGAKWVAEHGFPKSAKAWREVPGVGQYTAGAIASISLGEAAAVVDGNVERVYSRLRKDASEGSKLNRAAWNWANASVNPDHPASWNQALMELGATVCTPRKPDCQNCPINEHCHAHKSGIADQLPTKTKGRGPVMLESNVLVCERRGKVAVRQIPEGNWWGGMWEFPRTESEPPTGSLEIGAFQHVVTHHRIKLRVYQVPPSELIAGEWKTAEELSSLPLPAPQRRIAQMIFGPNWPEEATISSVKVSE